MAYNIYPGVDENFNFPPEIKTMYKGQILSTQNLDDYIDGGMWSYYNNNPTAPFDTSGTLIVSPILNNNTTIVTQLAIEYGTGEAIMKRYRGSGGWSAWKKINNDTLWKKGTIPNGVDIREYMYENGEGQYTSLTGTSTATMTGLPPALAADPLGFTAVSETLNSGTVITLTVYSVWAVDRYVATSAPTTGDGWTQWYKVQWDMGEANGNEADPNSSSGFKTLPYILTAGAGGGEAIAPTSANVEYDVNLSPDIPVSRYRFAIRDGNPRWGSFTAQRIALSNISFGGVQKLTSMTTDPTGAITFSRWFTGDFGNLKFDYVAPEGPRYIIGGGKVNGVRRVTMPFELWLEVEVPADTPAVGLFGDSNSVANNATIPIHDAWMSQYCREMGYFPVLYGHSGDNMASSGDPKHYKWNRWNHLDTPDVIVHANGANDIPAEEGGTSLAELKAEAQAEWVVGSKFSKIQHVALIKSKPSGANDAARKGLNTWYKQTPDPVREWHDIASPVTSGDAGGVLPQYLSDDNIHMNTAGHTAIKNALIAANKPMTYSPMVWKLDTDGVPYF